MKETYKVSFLLAAAFEMLLLAAALSLMLPCSAAAFSCATSQAQALGSAAALRQQPLSITSISQCASRSSGTASICRSAMSTGNPRTTGFFLK